MKCPNCGNEAQDEAIFCDQCGTRLQPPTAVPSQAQTPTGGTVQPAIDVRATPAAVCPNCGTSNTPGEMFCSECGTPLSAPQPEPEAIARAQRAAPIAGATIGAPACPDCGATVAPGDDFCYACGADLRALSASQPMAPVTEQPIPNARATQEPAQELPKAAEATSAQPQPTTAAPTECPACGAHVNPNDAFCEFCGAALIGVAPVKPTAQATSATAPAEALSAAPQPTAQARLIVAGWEIEIPLPPGHQTIVGREDPYSGVFPDIDLTPYGAEEGGVSRRHFKITQSGNQFLVEDLNSTNATLLNRQRLAPGVPVALSDGDEIRAGRLRLIFRVTA